MTGAPRIRALSKHLIRTLQASAPAPSPAPAVVVAAGNASPRAMSSSALRPSKPRQRGPFNFPLSPLPTNPLGEGRHIKTAAALIIGDEILNGKTRDTNSHYFARYCFDRGIELKRIEVIADDENEIISASRCMVRDYDFVITTGGIGPTHDDITYSALAKSFGQRLAHHPETLARMNAMGLRSINPEQWEATCRMALFPEAAEVLFVSPELWVPVVRMEGKLCVFPGIPRLFQTMLEALTPFLPLPPSSERSVRVQVFTRQRESLIASYLTALQERVKSQGIRVGSYPMPQKGVYVSLVGRNDGSVQALAAEVENAIDGRVVSDEEVETTKFQAQGHGVEAPDPSGPPVDGFFSSDRRAKG